MSNFFQSTNINAGKYYKNGIEIDLSAQGATGAQGSTGAQGAQGAQGATPQHFKMPLGSIIMWNAVNIEEGALPPYYIPADWVLCDGTLYGHIQTPDLRDKFIIGVGANSTFPYKGLFRK